MGKWGSSIVFSSFLLVVKCLTYLWRINTLYPNMHYIINHSWFSASAALIRSSGLYCSIFPSKSAKSSISRCGISRWQSSSGKNESIYQTPGASLSCNDRAPGATDGWMETFGGSSGSSTSGMTRPNSPPSSLNSLFVYSRSMTTKAQA